MGGGEKYIGTISEYLSNDHEVDLICCEPVNVAEIESRLTLNLSKANWVDWPPLSCVELESLTSDYDIFINATYSSAMVSRAKQSVYIIFFPHKIKLVPLGVAGERGFNFLRRLVSKGINIRKEAGFYEEEGNGRCWSKGIARLYISKKMFPNGVFQLPLAEPVLYPDSVIVENCGEKLNTKINSSSISIESGSKEDISITIYCKTFSPDSTGRGPDTRELGICFCLESAHNRRTKIDSLKWKLSRYLDRYGAEFIDSYDTKIVISEYSRQWTEKRWRVTGEILPPPIDLRRFTPPLKNNKKKVILSVGRFFYGGHNKKHLEMMTVFRGMHDLGLIPKGWEYHVVGNVHRDSPVHCKYFSDVENLAKGYPIKILENLNADLLLGEYQSASIFWHASGWGEDESLYPERFEHFGMTTCEAMVAGCVPVVIAKAGQLEIVQHGVNGFTFDDEESLIKNTSKLISLYGTKEFLMLSARASDSIARYSSGVFLDSLTRLLNLKS